MIMLNDSVLLHFCGQVPEDIGMIEVNYYYCVIKCSSMNFFIFDYAVFSYINLC